MPLHSLLTRAMRRGAIVALATGVGIAGFALLPWSQGQAAEVPLDWPALSFAQVATGLTRPVALAHPGDGSGRLFVIERAGRVRLVRNNALAATPVLDISPKVLTNAEQGLIGIAFPPNFASRQYFYLHYVTSRLGGVEDPGRSVIARFRLTGDVADPASEQTILSLDQYDGVHNGGDLAFGPDGYLYIAFGDGGPGGDPQNRAQARDDKHGKILRIDTESGASPYRVPADNPELDGRRDEVWALGLRNPWKFSFDRSGGAFWVGDVGQDAREELDLLPPGLSGVNFQWSCYEGGEPYSRQAPPLNLECTTGTGRMPLHDYPHTADGICSSVTGGYVYRGSRFPRLAGTYVWGDFCRGSVMGSRPDASGAYQHRQLGQVARYALVSFGQDEAGELYWLDYAGGRLMAIVAAPPCGVPPAMPGVSPTPGPSPTPAPFRIAVAVLQRDCASGQ